MAWLIPEHVPLPHDFLGFDPHSTSSPEDPQSYTRHLPHWRASGRCYFLTFRLRDSIPTDVLKEMKYEAQAWQKRLSEVRLRCNNTLPFEEYSAWQQFQQIQVRKLEMILDEGQGECLLKTPENRQPLIDAFHHFEGIRCEMIAYVIMPNHAHVLCRPLSEHTLEALSRAWKRHSSDHLHRRLGRSGSLWQEESFDRIIRDADHYTRVVKYIAKNPIRARLNAEKATVWFHPQILIANRT